MTVHPQHQVWELLRKHFPDDKADFIVSLVAPYLAGSGDYDRCAVRGSEQVNQRNTSRERCGK